MTRSLTAALLAASALVAGCDAASSPGARPGAVVVTAYVDRDASGTFDASTDSALTGFDVQLREDGAVVATAAVDADGTATFADVMPGTYQVVRAGTEPAGAALATNPSPTARVGFAGDTAEVEFRWVLFPASIQGVIYRDDDESGSYSPPADLAGSAVTVTLRADDAGQPGEVLATTVSDDNGVFAFTTLAPGSYFLELEEKGTMDYGAAGAVQRVDLTAGEVLPYDVVFTGDLTLPTPLSTIAEVRAMEQGTEVKVQGRVIVAPGAFTSSGGTNSEIWVQDSTGGISIFSIPTADASVELGDLLEVVGTLGAFNDQLQLTDPVYQELTAAKDTIRPRLVTGADVVALVNEGRLVQIGALEVTDVGSASGSGAFTVTTIAPDGNEVEVRINGASIGLVPTDFTVGERLFVTGVLTQFRGTGQIKPRSPSDVTEVTTIAAARALPVDTKVAVEGVVTMPTGVVTTGAGSEIWVQDATGGIAVFPVNATATPLALGDTVDAYGARKLNANQEQIGTSGSSNAFVPVIVKRGNGPEVAPATQTGTEAAALTLEGQLVTIPDWKVTSIGSASSFGTFNVTGIADGKTIQMRVGSSGAGITPADFTVDSVYTITGILSVFNSTVQIKPRQASDVVPQ